MKLIVAIVQDYDCDRLLSAVSGAGFRATRVASTGGFLRTGNTTVLLGVPDHLVERCVALVRTTCAARVDRRSEDQLGDPAEWYPPGLVEVPVGGAVLFVVPVSRFVQTHASNGHA